MKGAGKALCGGPIIPLHGYQQRWLLDTARFKAGMFARQTGKTFTTTLEVVDDCYAAWARNSRTRWVILSRGERQAREAMEAGVKLHAKAYDAAFKFAVVDQKEYDFIVPADRSTGTPEQCFKALEFELSGGSRVTALPANADTARGFSANVFLDEFAFHKDSREIWKALFPVISAGWKLRVTSTPNGKGNKFYELMTADDAVWSRHIVDIHQAVADGLPRDIAGLKAGIGDQDAWEQEFELQWADEASAWLTYDLITACEDENAGKPELYQGGQVYIGNDIARRNNLFVLWMMEEVGDVLWVRDIIAERNVTFAEQRRLRAELMAKYPNARMAIDQGGMGEAPVEEAQNLYPGRVDGVLLQGPRRLNLAAIGKDRFEDRKIHIPMGDTSLRADLHKVKKMTTSTGAIRLVADDDAEGHADRFWACMLGCGAAHGDGPPAAGASVDPDLTALSASVRPDRGGAAIGMIGGGMLAGLISGGG